MEVLQGVHGFREEESHLHRRIGELPGRAVEGLRHLGEGGPGAGAGEGTAGAVQEAPGRAHRRGAGGTGASAGLPCEVRDRGREGRTRGGTEGTPGGADEAVPDGT